jgi:predicted metalloprotease
VFTLGDNPLLGEEVQATGANCELPSFGRADERLTAYYLAVVGCLNDVWGSVLRAANIPFRPPVLRVTADLPDSSCGRAPNDETVAYYCGRDETIYMSTKRGLADGGGTRAPSHLATLSHEYGHHVQLLSGMLAAASRRIEDAGERSPSGLELTRRVELQANCLAGVFLFAAGGHGSLSTSLARQANQDFHNAVVEPAAENSHGSPSHQGWWADSGFGSGHPSACNTWNAPPDEVS